MADLVTITLTAGTRVTCDVELAKKFQQQAETETPAAETPAADLKGEALDAALKAAELPLTGSADEKRQRLAEYVAANSAG